MAVHSGRNPFNDNFIPAVDVIASITREQLQAPERKNTLFVVTGEVALAPALIPDEEVNKSLRRL